VAAGATDLIYPFGGWTGPGVFTLGAAQIALKQGFSIGRHVVLAGTGPLLYLVAHQYLRMGLRPAAVLDVGSPFPSIGMVSGLASGGRAAAQGLRYLASVISSRVPFHCCVSLRKAEHEDNGRLSFKFGDAKGSEKRIECDAIAFGYGLRSETQMFSLAGCEFAFDPASLQWLPRIDDGRRTTVRGIYAAGDCAGILGAAGAEASGELAAISLLADSSIGNPRLWRKAILRRRIARLRRFQGALAKMFPPQSLCREALSNDLIVCRCERISAGLLRQAVSENGSSDINRVKAFTRVGMGLCQSRYCQRSAIDVIARAAHLAPEAVGAVRVQPPIKPIQLVSKHS
jgi:NADPH-dependent 2,4-dienoyl-CoA reductase/sulfur reductase-like enzyme